MVVLVLVAAYIRSNFCPVTQVCSKKKATKWRLEMVKSIGTGLKSKVWWPMLSGDWWRLSFPVICLTIEEKPWKTLQPRKLTRSGIKLGPTRWEAMMLPLDPVGFGMYRTAQYPESSCAIHTNLKEIGTQWIAQEFIFYFINMVFTVVQFDKITSKFDSVASFCYRFAQLGTNCSLHKELPISSLVHKLNDNSVPTNYFLSNACN